MPFFGNLILVSDYSAVHLGTNDSLGDKRFSAVVDVHMHADFRKINMNHIQLRSFMHHFLFKAANLSSYFFLFFLELCRVTVVLKR
jgi:hypothetical protein